MHKPTSPRPARTTPSAPSAPTEPTIPPGAASSTVRGPQVLIYSPDGALGGTFTCTLCHCQAWQPDLLQHLPSCPFMNAFAGESARR